MLRLFRLQRVIPARPKAPVIPVQPKTRARLKIRVLLKTPVQPKTPVRLSTNLCSSSPKAAVPHPLFPDRHGSWHWSHAVFFKLQPV